MAEESPDVCLLNEVGLSGWRLRRFSRLMGMRRASGLRPFGRGVTNAVVVRPPWRIVTEELIGFSRRRRSTRRGMMLAVVGRSGHRLTTIALHLGLADREREEHARELTDLLPTLRHPLVVGGDLNEPPTAPAAAWISDRLWDAHRHGVGALQTYPAVAPEQRIDFIFVSDGIRVDRAWVKRDPSTEMASDHLPVFADLSLEG